MIDNDTARGFVRGAQISALVVVVIEECWNVKSDAQNRLKKSGQTVVKSKEVKKPFHGITPSDVSHAGAIMDQFGRSLKST